MFVVLLNLTINNLSSRLNSEVRKESTVDLQLRENPMYDGAGQELNEGGGKDDDQLMEDHESDKCKEVGFEDQVSLMEKGSAMRSLGNTRVPLNEITSKSYGLNNEKHTVAVIGEHNRRMSNNHAMAKVNPDNSPSISNIRDNFERSGPDKRRRENLGVNLNKNTKSTKVKKRIVHPDAKEARSGSMYDDTIMCNEESTEDSMVV